MSDASISTGPNVAPKVFISYSHDSAEHSDRARHLADRLRADGLDCMIDQYIFSPPEGWSLWMDKQIRDADFVLLVCTETYHRRVMNEEQPGTGLGVRWEGHLTYQHLYNHQAVNAKFMQALAILEKALGPDHSNLAYSLNNLGILYHDQGKLTEAVPLFKRALAIYQQVLGPDHPDVAISLNNLALLYQDQGKLAMAEPLFKRALVNPSMGLKNGFVDFKGLTVGRSTQY